MVTPMPQIAMARPKSLGGLMSNSTACDSGTSAAPPTPCRKRNSTICGSDCRQAAQGRGDGEDEDRDQKHFAAAELPGQPAGERNGDGGGDDIRGQHPAHLVLGGRQRALHAGQRDIGDGGVQRLHDGRQHHRKGDQAVISARVLRCRAAAASRSRRRRRLPPLLQTSVFRLIGHSPQSQKASER